MHADSRPLAMHVVHRSGSRTDGNADIAVDGKAEFLVPAADVQTLAQCVEQMASSLELPRLMNEVNRKLVMRHFSLVPVVKSFWLMYDERWRFIRHGQEGH